MADEDAQIRQTVKYFVALAAVGKTLTEEQKKEINDKASSKLMKTCCAANTAQVAESSTFPFLAGKAKKLTLDRYVNEFLPELAIAIVHKKLLEKDRRAPKPKVDEDKVATLLKTIRAEIAAKHDIKTKGATSSGVTARLTDTSGYTGSHKERFDETGKGKGIEGRVDVKSNSGYVGAYKNEGTYDAAKK